MASKYLILHPDVVPEPLKESQVQVFQGKKKLKCQLELKKKKKNQLSGLNAVARYRLRKGLL